VVWWLHRCAAVPAMTTRQPRVERSRAGGAEGQWVNNTYVSSRPHERIFYEQYRYVLHAQLDKRRGGSRRVHPPDP